MVALDCIGELAGVDLSAILHLEVAELMPSDKPVLAGIRALECFTFYSAQCSWEDDLEFMVCIPWRKWHQYGRLQILNGPSAHCVPTSFSKAFYLGDELRDLGRCCPHGRSMAL